MHVEHHAHSKLAGTPDEPLVLEYTHPCRLLPYREEEHFWDHKEKLLPDYGRILELDKRALAAPTSLKTNPRELVVCLTHGLTSDLEKVRVLMRWIGDNIEYDVEFLNTGVRGDDSIDNVLRTGRSVCQGYSNVLAHFCRLVNVKCDVISGLSKGASYYPGKVFDTRGDDPCRHAWNVVQIQGVWYLCDPTWAAGSTDEVCGRYAFTKEWKEPWFLTHPEAFLVTHLPFERGKGVNTSPQLVDKPTTSLEEWNNRVLSDPMVHAYDIKPISHLHSVIRTQSAEVFILFKNPFSGRMRQWTTLTLVSTESKDRKCENNVMLYSTGHYVHVDVRLPGRGSYMLQIMGRMMSPDWPNQEETIPVLKLFWYKIECELEVNLSGGFLPSSGEEWGMPPHCKASGFQLINPENPLIKTKDGTCEIKMKLPIAGVVPTFHRLHHAQANTSDLEPCVYGEKAGSLVTYRIRCPYPGEYRFEIKYKAAPDEKTGFYTAAAFLIQCQRPSEDAFCYTDGNHFGGPRQEFYTRFGLRTAAHISTLKARNGRVPLVIRMTRPVQLHATLQMGKERNLETVQKISLGSATKFLIRPRRKGYHFFKLYAYERSENYGPLVAMFCVTL